MESFWESVKDTLSVDQNILLDHYQEEPFSVSFYNQLNGEKSHNQLNGEKSHSRFYEEKSHSRFYEEKSVTRNKSNYSEIEINPIITESNEKYNISPVNLERSIDPVRSCNYKTSRRQTIGVIRSKRKISPNSRFFECNTCNVTYRRKYLLMIHMRECHQENLFPCEKCGKCFTNKTKLKYHSKLHGADISYDCDICFKLCVSESNLGVHMRIHTGEKPFSCDVCGIEFAQKGNMMRHIKRHR
jgi:hypothetical protein